MENIRFSVIIPSYNSKKEVKRAIESITKQKFQNYEIIVIDDCSTDNTYEELSSRTDIRIIKYEDFSLYYQALIMAKSFKVAPFVTHVYDTKSDSMTTSVSIQKLQDLYSNVIYLLENIKKTEETKKLLVLNGIKEVIINSERMINQYLENTENV